MHCSTEVDGHRQLSWQDSPSHQTSTGRRRRPRGSTERRRIAKNDDAMGNSTEQEQSSGYCMHAMHVRVRVFICILPRGGRVQTCSRHPLSFLPHTPRQAQAETEEALLAPFACRTHAYAGECSVVLVVACKGLVLSWHHRRRRVSCLVCV